MPADIRYLLQKLLPNLPGQDSDARAFSYRSIGGGSINSAFQILTKLNKRWFGKFNNAVQFPGLFIKESNGLDLLRSLSPIRVPATILCTEVEGIQVLLLEWIDEGLRTDDFWRRFGQQLALQHRVSQAAPAVTSSAPRSVLTFGLGEDNYMGALIQNNTPTPTWEEFFRDHRLEPQVRLAADKSLLDSAACRQFEKLYPRLPDFFPPEPPSLLHGDLWSGNFLCDADGQPVLIDPAVYFGHRNMDLAMTTLFGGFEPAFYETYNDIYPFPKNYLQAWEIANLYPLLIHLNLFGPAYGGNILHTIRRF
jgi:fructosamine-3-kinase